MRGRSRRQAGPPACQLTPVKCVVLTSAPRQQRNCLQTAAMRAGGLFHHLVPSLAVPGRSTVILPTTLCPVRAAGPSPPRSHPVRRLYRLGTPGWPGLKRFSKTSGLVVVLRLVILTPSWAARTARRTCSRSCGRSGSSPGWRQRQPVRGERYRDSTCSSHL